ncbi:MAG: LON peptidase substrate-binding domain-containing protein [Candidatus Eisenbacteria bacterium]|uniref:LON peptidase substrate-binding domain-containing protein n=1 Tax=Eiseniibacteriota bacterium TaxID=2212470 RepID=A0A9D6QJ33_UNCEI|nr:LON peptidase substrate-binding domain-containing protein [Candidatus Eisenbacteria bacterium]MBI3538805.1 LON peptidase substrate-binding domain-containing protein [Candidatus Eisenbacteria bacterium]
MQFVPQHPVPVFPLPGVVLFPGVELPLHVFELRYRTMVREALSGERVIALALLKPGYESDYHASPEFFPVGCLARFEDVEWLPDDCYDLRLRGLARVRLGRLVREFPYRAVRVEVLGQAPYTEDDPLIQLERRALLDARARLAHLAVPREETPAEAGEGLAFEPLVNTVCMGLALDPTAKLALLEMESVLERARRARETIEEQLRWAERGRRSGGDRN